MNSFLRIILAISSVFLLIGCSNNKETEIKKPFLNNLDDKTEKWINETKALINSSEIEKNQFIDYSELHSRETSLDNTWRAVNILNAFSTSINKSSILLYIKSYEPENTIERLMLNSISNTLGNENLYTINNDKEIQVFLNSSIDDLEKLDMLYLYHLYSSENNLNLDKNTIDLIINFLDNIKLSKDTHYGYFYDLIFLCERYNIVSEDLDYEDWEQKLSSGFEKLDLIDLYFILKINLVLKNEITSEQLQNFFDLQEITNAIKNERDNSIFSTYIMTDISRQIGQINKLNKDIIKEFIMSQQSENGGFYVRKILTPDITATILSENTLINLGGNYKNNSQVDFSSIFSSNLRWKYKYYGHNIFTEKLQENNKNELQIELESYYNSMKNINSENLYSNLILFEDVLYAMQLSDKISTEIPQGIIEIMHSTSDHILKNHKDFTPIEISFAIDTFNILKYKISNEQVVSSYLSSFYDEELNIFIYKDRGEMMMNYFIIKSLLNIKNDFKNSALKSVILEFADFDKGGINTFKDEFETSSLLTTFYGIELLKSLEK